MCQYVLCERDSTLSGERKTERRKKKKKKKPTEIATWPRLGFKPIYSRGINSQEL